MPRHHERKTSRGLIPPTIMLRAAREAKKDRQSIRAVAIKYGINYRTLTRYCRKFTDEELNNPTVSTPSTVIGYKKTRQILKDEDEVELEKYMLLASNIYFDLSPKDIRRMAYEFAVCNNLKVPASWESNKSAGYDWFTSFMTRHPAISLRTPEAAGSDELIERFFFENLDTIIQRHNFKPQDIWNMDETTVTTGQNSDEVDAEKEIKQEDDVESAKKIATISLAAAVSGDGISIPPFFVSSKENSVVDSNNDDPVSGNKEKKSPSSMTEARFVAFLKHFHAHVKSTEEKPCLLLLVNHSFRIPVDGLKFAAENGIMMLSFPPDSAHHLQLLDKSNYEPFKKNMKQAVDQWMVDHQEIIQKQDFSKFFEPDKPVIKTLDDEMDDDSEENEDIKPEFQRCTLFVDQISDPNEPTTDESDASDLDDPLSIGNDDSSAIIPQDPVDPAMQQQPSTMSEPGPSGLKKSQVDSQKVSKTRTKTPSRKLQRAEKRKIEPEIPADTSNQIFIVVKEEEPELKKSKVLNENTDKTKVSEDKKINEKPVDSESSDDDDLICLVCSSPYPPNTLREAWIRCRKCKLWAHDSCTPVLKKYICHKCDS